MHTLPADISLQARYQRLSLRLAMIVGLITIPVLVGWIINTAILKKPVLPLWFMYPLPALLFVILSVAFIAAHSTGSSRQLTAKLLSMLILGAPVFIVLILPDGPGSKNISLWLRMTPAVAQGFMLASGALLLLHSKPARAQVAGQYLAIALFAVGMVAVLGYLYHAEKIYMFSLMPMSLPTGVCFMLVSLALLTSHPQSGLMKVITSSLTGSVLLRAFIPFTILIPIALGLLALSGYNQKSYSVEHTFVYFTLSVVMVFIGMVVYNSYLLNRRDMLKRKTDITIKNREEEISAIFENAPEAVIVINSGGYVTKWNPEAGRLFGWTQEDAIGEKLSALIIPEENREAHEQGIVRFLRSGKGSMLGKTIEVQALTRNGKTIDVSLRISSFSNNNELFFIGFLMDISSRKLLEHQLRNFNEYLSGEVKQKTSELTEMLERITDGFVAFDKNFCYKYINRKAAQMLGLHPPDLIGKCIWDIYPEFKGTATYKAFEKAMTMQEHVLFSDYYEQFDLWQETSVYPSPGGLSVFIKDISQQKIKEREINQARELSEKLTESLPGVFYFYDEHGRFIRWNRQLQEVTGYTNEEIAAIHPVQLFIPEDQEYIAGRIATVFEKGFNDAEATFLSKDGKRTTYYFRATLIRLNGAPCLLGTGIDITERKKAEKELRESERQYKLLFEKNPLPMWMISLPDFNVIHVNNATLGQYGYTRGEFMQIKMPQLIHPAEYPKMNAHPRTSFRGLHHAGIWRHRKSDESTIYTDIVTHDMYYNNMPVRLVLAKDVTEQVEAEEKLRTSFEEVKRLTEHLQKIREEERMHISHEIHDELGQLLTGLKMDISWVKKQVKDRQSLIEPKINEALEMVDRVIHTVRRIASELRPPLLDDLGLSAAMQWHINEFAKRSGIASLTDLTTEELALTIGQKTGLYRILQEALTNVGRHSGASKVVVTMQKEADTAVLAIKDDGTGFDIESPKSKTLGLTGMKERAEAMGGQFTVQSFPGKGTTVLVSIPV